VAASSLAASLYVGSGLEFTVSRREGERGKKRGRLGERERERKGQHGRALTS